MTWLFLSDRCAAGDVHAIARDDRAREKPTIGSHGECLEMTSRL